MYGAADLACDPRLHLESAEYAQNVIACAANTLQGRARKHPTPDPDTAARTAAREVKRTELLEGSETSLQEADSKRVRT